MISELINNLTKKISIQSISDIIGKGITRSISDVEKDIEKRINKTIQINVDKAVKKVKRELLNSGMLMFSIMLIIIGVFIILAKYFPAEYLLIICGAILFSVTIASNNFNK